MTAEWNDGWLIDELQSDSMQEAYSYFSQHRSPKLAYLPSQSKIRQRKADLCQTVTPNEYDVLLYRLRAKSEHRLLITQCPLQFYSFQSVNVKVILIKLTELLSLLVFGWNSIQRNSTHHWLSVHCFLTWYSDRLVYFGYHKWPFYASFLHIWINIFKISSDSVASWRLCSKQTIKKSHYTEKVVCVRRN